MPYHIVIDSVEYPVESWETVRQGETLRESWSDGWAGGMGEGRRRSADGHYITDGLDPSSPPYLRLAPKRVLGPNLTGLDTTLPLYHFQATDAGGTDFLYFLRGQYAWKVDRDTNTLKETKDFGAGAQAGRPAIYDGTPQVALGDSVDAQELTTCATPPATDTWTAKTGTKALAFAVTQDEDTPMLARAFSTNLIDLSSDGATFGGDSEVGDTTTPITDLLMSMGELIVIKPDGPYKFDAKGNSLPLQEFVGRKADASSTDGACSHGYGPYSYWVSASGLARILGDSIDWIGPESDPRWGFRPLSMSPDPLSTGQWNSVTAYGRWIYGTHQGTLFFGYILEDGRVRWHGIIEMGAQVARCFVDDGPTLWYNESSFIVPLRYDLHDDGSPKTPLGSNRGVDFDGVFAYLPETDFGREDREKQLTRLWVITENFPGDSSVSLTLRVHRDGGVHEGVGAAITTSGFFERSPAIGSASCYRVMPSLMVATSAYDPSTGDPRIVGFGIEARTATLYRAQMRLTPKTLQGSVGVRDAISNLRRLRDGPSVAILEPDANTTFNGYIVGLQEKATGSEEQGDFGYLVDVYIERWDVP